MPGVRIIFSIAFAAAGGFVALSSFAQNKPYVPRPEHPICKPQKAPPKPPAQPPTPGEPTPPPPVLLPKPTPPANLPVDTRDASRSGVKVVDRALDGKIPKSALPLWYNYPWKKVKTPNLWTEFAADVLRSQGQSLLNSQPADIQWHCPAYPNMDADQKLAFWIRFLSIIAEAESTMNPLAVTRDKAVGSNIFSTGLLMISLDSSRQEKWGCNFIQTQDDLFDWRKNMTCAIRIMNILMAEDNALSYNGNNSVKRTWYGISRYWAPLRDGRVRNDERRFCIDETVKLRRKHWADLSKTDKHPSLYAQAYRKAGETDFERFLRLMNTYPFCHNRSSRADSFWQ